MPPLKILIVGAGIGGPAAAVGLARNGHDVTIYERSDSASDVGYTFRITPNSERCLKHLGMNVLAGGAVAANTVRMFDAEGHVIMEVTENRSDETVKVGSSVFAYRPQLHQQLMDTALVIGVHIKFGVKVVSVDVRRTSLVLEDESRIFADLILTADGVHSAIRASIIDSAQYYPCASTGHNAFRFMLSKYQVENNSIASSIVNDNVRMVTWAGNKEKILVYPVDYWNQYTITCTHPEHLSYGATSSEDNSTAAIAYNQKAPLSTIMSIYRAFEPRAICLFELADSNGFRVWKLLDMDEIPHWSLNHTALLGDACHPVSPFGFSGASMAIEDAVTLSVLLTYDIQAEKVPELLNLYEEIRKPRVGRVRDSSRGIARDRADKEFS